MDLSNQKIAELLKNPEIVGMIASLASGFSSGSGESTASETSSPVEPEILPEQTEAIEPSARETFTQLQDSPLGVPGKNAYSDRRIALLQAIKPYVSDTKKDKVDGLVKAIGVAGILSNYAGGMFGNLFGKQ